MESKDTVPYEIFPKLRAQCEIPSKSFNKNNLLLIHFSISDNPKSFRKHFIEKRCSYNIPANLYLEHTIGNSGDEITELFAVYFSSEYETLPSNLLMTESENSVSNYDIFCPQI